MKFLLQMASDIIKLLGKFVIAMPSNEETGNENATQTVLNQLGSSAL